MHSSSAPRSQQSANTGSSRDPAPNLISSGQQLRWLLGLHTMAIAQPLLSRLSENSIFLRLERIEAPAVWLFLFTCIVPGPICLFAISRTIGMRSAQKGESAFLTVAFFLCTLLLQLWMKWFSSSLSLRNAGVPDTLFLLAAFVVAWIVVGNLRHDGVVRQFVGLLAWSALLVPASFVISKGIHPVLFPERSATRTSVHFDNPAPVVMLVFDGLNGMALLKEDREIDADRYPGFARLASMSNWYANASSVHPRTDKAVPAILSGRRPVEGAEPLASNYPDNLFQLIFESDQYDMTVFEPYTRLCPQKMLPKTEPPGIKDQVQILTDTMSRVYLSAMIPDELNTFQSGIPRTWFDIADESKFDESSRRGLFIYGWDVDRQQQISHFEKCLAPSEKPGFRFLHVVLPHYPWMYLPSGRHYYSNLAFGDTPVGAHGSLGEDWGTDELAVNQGWQRYLLQLGFLDRELSGILDRLECDGILESSLIVVVGDHGAAFKAGLTRRTPTQQTLGDVMSVPLFIKLPGQTSGTISDRNVETIDVLPTIADALALTQPLATDGDSLLDTNIPPRLRKQMDEGKLSFVVEPEFPHRFDYLRRMTGLFGTGSNDRLWTALNTIPKLIGQPIAKSSVAPDVGPTIEMFHNADYLRPVSDQFVPCVVRGRIDVKSPEQPVQLAIAVNGTIVATTRTYQDELIRDQWSALLPESAFQAGTNETAIYEVRTTPEGHSFRLCPISKDGVYL